MKILLQRTQAVQDGSLVELGSNNIVSLRGQLTPLGVAGNCRSVDMQDSTTSEVTTQYICDVTVSGDCLAILSGNAPAAGCPLYPTENGHLSAVAAGDPVAKLTPRAYPSTSDYIDGDLVSVVLLNL